MSYILDALQKSQSEQAADGVALRVQQAQTRRNTNSWLIAVLAVVLLLNAGLLAWVFLLKEDPVTATATPANTTPKTTAAQVPTTVGAAPTQATVVESTPPTGAPAASAVQAPIRVDTPAILNNSAAAANSSPRAEDVQTVSPPPTAPPSRQVPRLALKDLPTAEQSLYNGFTYSTHIYTDDPSLCAIVVDGQRLQAGDAFKGLTVTAITEQGVVFEENRRGIIREIEVNLLEQWEN